MLVSEGGGMCSCFPHFPACHSQPLRLAPFWGLLSRYFSRSIIPGAQPNKTDDIANGFIKWSSMLTGVYLASAYALVSNCSHSQGLIIDVTQLEGSIPVSITFVESVRYLLHNINLIPTPSGPLEPTSRIFQPFIEPWVNCLHTVYYNLFTSPKFIL